MRIVLASGSPRRRELLKYIYNDFEIITSDVDEDIAEDNPSKVVEELSGRKAKAVYDSLVTKTANEELIVIGADTIVYYDGEILGKPDDESEAASMLSMLSDRTHQVYTGVTVFVKKKDKESVISFSEKTDVTFYNLDKFDIAEYIGTGSPMDKAGAYGIQDGFSRHVKKIDGEYNNVVGLPVARLYDELKLHKLL
ncbi:MAG: Maf family protein [Lachnospiraceae bacterium]|nr:Maf family protein [Lachnospiraceae bacterium]